MKRPIGIASVCAVALLLACDGPSRSVAPVTTLPEATAPVASLRGTVDLVAGTMTFESVAPRLGSLGRSSAVSASIYGNQGVTVRIYNSPVTVTASAPGKKRYTANVGVRNLQPFPIGDEQGGPFPSDTSGIFVFMNGGPTPTGSSSPCAPACTVTVANAHGRLAFNAPDQPYWYWKDRLTATGGLRDTTLTRQSWSFEADTQVTGFTFDVLVAAAWPAPHETRWKTEFPGDSVPYTTAEPIWRRSTLGTAGTVTPGSPSAGMITMTAPHAASQFFTRRDSLASGSNAYIEARFRRNSAGGDADVSFGIDDNTKFIAVGANETKYGFLKQDYGFIGNSFETTTSAFHTYQIRKFGSDSVVLYLDGIRRDSRTYASLENSTATTIPAFFYFGIPGVGSVPIVSGAKSASWDYVVYEIGVSQP